MSWSVAVIVMVVLVFLGCIALAFIDTRGKTAQEEAKGKLVLFAGIDKVRFKRVVRPGDTLDLRVEIITARSSVGKAKMVATVQDELVCRGEVMFALVDAP